MVSVESILIGVGIVLLLPLGFIVGRFMDQDWKCAQLRRFLRRNYLVLNIIEGDGKTYQTRVVNADNDVAKVDNYLWIITKGRIYRKDKQQVGTKLQKKDVHWGTQGAPNVFVGKDDLKPIPLDDPNKSHVKPDELGSTANAWILNEKAKIQSGDKNAKILQYATLGLLVITLLLAFGSWDNSMKTQDALKQGTIQVASSQPAGGSMTITQNKGGTTTTSGG